MSNEEIDQALSFSKQYAEYIAEGIAFKYKILSLFKETGIMLSFSPTLNFLSLEEFYKKTQL